MFDFDVGKLFIIGVVALVVIGPKDLPRVLRQLGQAMGKLRRMSSEFQRQFMDAMHEADLADLKAEAQKLAKEAHVEVNYDPVREVKAHMTEALQHVDAPALNVPPAEVPPDMLAEIPNEGPVKGPGIESHLVETHPVAAPVGQALEAPHVEKPLADHAEAVKNTPVLP